MNEPGNPQAMHPGEATLQRFADGELGAAEMEAIRRHIAGCPECRQRLDAIGRAAELYLGYHRHILKAQDPAPPRSWEDLRPKLIAMPAASSRGRGGLWRGWLAVAAATVVAVAVYSRINRPTPVRAADLLRKAAAAEAPPNPARRIRVRTGQRSVVRPAVISAGRPGSAEPGLEAMFLAAHFSWQDPLSVRSFAAWREQLPQKQDRVRVLQGSFEIHTTAQSGPLSEAVLVLDAGNLHPVSETLLFTGERVEIAEADPVVAAPAQPAPVLSRAGSSSLPPAPPAAGPAQELRVIAALHAIGADLGEPVQVTRQDGSLLVEVGGLTPAREQQVRATVATIPGVTFRVDVHGATPMDAVPGGRNATAAGVRSRLEAVLGEEGVNRILDASDGVMARVYALRGLSRRFPQLGDAQLADADRDVLAAIRSEHVSGIRTHLRALQTALAPLLPEVAPEVPPKVPPAEAPPPTAWQARAGLVFTAAQQVDRLLNGILAGGEDFAPQAPKLAEALRQLDAEVAAEVAGEVRQ